MIVSHNELVTAVYKAFLGLRRCCGEADVIANMVADLQMVGLNGVGHFNKALPYLAGEKDGPITLTKPASDRIDVDMHGSSLVCHLPNILDYAVEQLVHTKSLTIHVRHCHNRWLAYSELVKLAAKGLACKAQWKNGSDAKQTRYILNKGCVFPELFQSEEVTSSDESHHDMIIELSVADFSVSSSGVTGFVRLDSTSLRDTYVTAWKEGIEVDDVGWQQLKQAAKVFLVENSETSAKGAGELIV
ncbi:DUF3726 domain-containing protein [Photobacterium sp. DNB23_23_1]|uniref:DUF3726 domain-containing protein n=1 Tax=Photobacterium pectinilyticum TaxID=2906793 RepID=A0ABT1MZM2_9GAMM|nr:DUF3726 domain-containing protein [Photobacterium sp. ZSDE20]MCQ1057844.1 DUF3726 domain-containing protein [Photobacterium sp. ZSDE20]MDD1822244.1 DUF3726 domain-containing protein [Photobacterium sp. ZSDE20]